MKTVPPQVREIFRQMQPKLDQLDAELRSAVQQATETKAGVMRLIGESLDVLESENSSVYEKLGAAYAIRLLYQTMEDAE